MPEFKYGDIIEKIIGACFRIHNTLGMDSLKLFIKEH
jgi:hypothetical protein